MNHVPCFIKACRWLLVAAAICHCTTATATEHFGREFIGEHNFSSFTKTKDTLKNETVWLSPEIQTDIHWDELIVSWNARLPAGATVQIGARAVYPEHTTKFFIMGIWSGDPGSHHRTSVVEQKDADGNVLTDTLSLKLPCHRVQIQLAAKGSTINPSLSFLGLCFADTKAGSISLSPNRAAWGKILAVPERTQLDFSAGKDSWCSPTSTSMILAWWAEVLKRPELNRTVPDVAREVFDPNWPGTGNWPFNTAFAGSFPGMRAYVSRFSDVSELEDWTAGGLPVAVSVAYSVLKGKLPRKAPDGHLVVCVGFTENGDVIVNDPGTRHDIRQVFPRQNLVRAWSCSHNTVYLIYPDSTETPVDRFRHWDFQSAQLKEWSGR